MAHNFTNNIFDGQNNYLFTKCTQCGCRDDDNDRAAAMCPLAPQPTAGNQLNNYHSSSQPVEQAVKNFEIKVPYDMVTLKRRIAKLLFRYHLHGTAVRKRFINENNEDSYFTEIIVRGSPAVVAQFSHSLNSMINSMNPPRSFQFPVSVSVIHDDMQLSDVKILQTDSYCRRTGSSGGDEILVSRSDVDSWNYDGFSVLSTVEAIQKVVAPFLPNVHTIQNALSSYTGGLISEVTTKRIFIQNEQENISEIVEITDLMMDWEWLEEMFRSKQISKKEIKDASGKIYEVKLPKHLKDGDTLYISFA